MEKVFCSDAPRKRFGRFLFILSFVRWYEKYINRNKGTGSVYINNNNNNNSNDQQRRRIDLNHDIISILCMQSSRIE